jgi:thymidylate synthase (FAD)
MKEKFSELIRLDGNMADDLTVVRSARVSFGKSAKEMGEAEVGLINFLMRERHGTPFEHCVFRFYIKCPIFVAREWFRHRIGSFNEISGRYSVIEQDYFVPESSDIRTQVGKPGSYTFESIQPEAAAAAVEIMYESSERSFDAYNRLLMAGVAKEVARMVLPVNTYTEFYWTVNARSLMNFLSLRSAAHAQKEIRDYSLRIEDTFKSLMPITYEAWVKNGKVCP